MEEGALCRRFGRRILMYGQRHLKDEQAAHDLVQQVLLAVLEAARQGRIENPERIDAFVLGTARNICWDMRRASARQRRLAERAAAELPEAWEPVWPRLELERLWHCLGELDGRARTVIAMTFAEERSAEEIGAALALTPGNVRVLRHRALARLQDCVGGGEK
jgi:RNA polymerase sigma-70 factor, ECF subfamily